MRHLSFQEAMQIVELPYDSLVLSDSMTPIDRQKAIDTFIKLIKKHRKTVAKKYHPDLPRNGSEEEEKLKKINEILDVLLLTKLLPEKITVKKDWKVENVFNWPGGPTMWKVRPDTPWNGS